MGHLFSTQLWGDVGCRFVLLCLLLPARGQGRRLWGVAALCVCRGSNFPEEAHSLGSKGAELKKEHDDFLAGGNTDVRGLGDSVESQRL